MYQCHLKLYLVGDSCRMVSCRRHRDFISAEVQIRTVKRIEKAYASSIPEMSESITRE